MIRLVLALSIASLCTTPAWADPSAAARAWSSPCVRWLGIGTIPRLEHGSRFTRVMTGAWSGVICSGGTEVGAFHMQFSYDGAVALVGGSWSSTLYGHTGTAQGILENFEQYPQGTTFDMTSSTSDPCRYTLLLGHGPGGRDTLFIIGETGCSTPIEGHSIAFVVEQEH